MVGSFVLVGGSSHTVAIASLAVAGLVFLLVLYNQLRVRAVTFRRTFIFPTVLFVIALWVGHMAGTQGSGLGGLFTHGGASAALFSGTLALALFFGLARGFLTEIWTETDGTVLRRGGPIVAVLWLLTLVCRGGVAVIAYKNGVPEPVNLVWLEFAVTILAQNAIVVARVGGAL